MNQFVESLKNEINNQLIIQCQCNVNLNKNININNTSVIINLTDNMNITLTFCGYNISQPNSGFICQLILNEYIIQKHFEDDVTLHVDVEDNKKMLFYGRQFAFAIKNTIDIISIPIITTSEFNTTTNSIPINTNTTPISSHGSINEIYIYIYLMLSSFYLY